MGILSNFFDKFKASDFSIAPNKKIKTIQKEFKDNFGLTLRVFKGNQHADGELTIAGLNRKTTAKVNAAQEDLKIKASTPIASFEEQMMSHFGLKVQVADEFNIYLVENHYTLGQASRKQDTLDYCKRKGFNSIEEWLEKENCKSVEEYFRREGRLK